jgi:hypothetical protein
MAISAETVKKDAKSSTMQFALRVSDLVHPQHVNPFAAPRARPANHRKSLVSNNQTVY